MNSIIDQQLYVVPSKKLKANPSREVIFKWWFRGAGAEEAGWFLLGENSKCAHASSNFRAAVL